LQRPSTEMQPEDIPHFSPVSSVPLPTCYPPFKGLQWFETKAAAKGQFHSVHPRKQAEQNLHSCWQSSSYPMGESNLSPKRQ